jgi:hypothetical protein
MTIHQYLTDWFKQFKITVLPEEREVVKKNFMSGYECGELERCPFLHMMASLIANKRNLHLFDEWFKTRREYGDCMSIDSEDWMHLSQLAEEWTHLKSIEK